MTDAAKDKNREAYLFGLVHLLHLVCNMMQEAGLESVLSAAFSLKHVTDVKKGFIAQEEAMDKAKELGLSPETAKKCIQQTLSGRFTLYVKGKFVKPPELKYPDIRSLVQLVQTEGGRSEVSCAIDYADPSFLEETPMGHTDDSCPSDFTELRQTIGSHLWLTSLEVSAAALTPTTLDTHIRMDLYSSDHGTVAGCTT